MEFLGAEAVKAHVADCSIYIFVSVQVIIKGDNNNIKPAKVLKNGSIYNGLLFSAFRN